MAPTWLLFRRDGTLTSIAHSIDESTPIMGVNSHPRMNDSDGSYGFYMGSDPENFKSDIHAVMEGRGIINVLPRLQAEIVTTSGNTIVTDPALNDLLVANTTNISPRSTGYRGCLRESTSSNTLLGVFSRRSWDRELGSGTCKH